MTPFDLTTHDGQKAHYRAVQTRLGIRARSVAPPHFSKPLYDEPIGPQRPFVERYEKLPSSVKIPEIIDAVCFEYGISRSEFEGARRWQGRVRARMVFYFIARKHGRRSLPQIAYYAKKDHTTVLYGVRRVENMRPMFEPLLSRSLIRLGVSAKGARPQ